MAEPRRSLLEDLEPNPPRSTAGERKASDYFRGGSRCRQCERAIPRIIRNHPRCTGRGRDFHHLRMIEAEPRWTIELKSKSLHKVF